MHGEPLAERRERLLAAAGAELGIGVGPGGLAAGVLDVANGSRVQPPEGAAALVGIAGNPAVGQLELDVLPRPYFLRQLQREKRRSERSKAPLSIALFRFQGGKKDELRNVGLMLECLHASKRETDILGDLEHDLIAVLLPDTQAAGTQRFVQKIGERATELQFAHSTGTYPNHLFETLGSGTAAPVEFHPFFVEEIPEPRRLGDHVKRAIDLIGASTALVALSPLMAIAAAAIALTSPGPVIFKQVRVGRRGVPFVFYKFRTMHCNADDRVHREYVAGLIAADSQGAGGRKTWSKLDSDSRITPLGRLLRKTSVDELPQLFNVLKGDLSLVGPRPALPYEVEKYQAWHLRRVFARKPGISGMWQANSRGDATFEDMVRMDIQYIRNWSVGLDLKILVKTVKVVLRRTGAG